MFIVAIQVFPHRLEISLVCIGLHEGGRRGGGIENGQSFLIISAKCQGSKIQEERPWRWKIAKQSRNFIYMYF